MGNKQSNATSVKEKEDVGKQAKISN